MNNRLLQNDAVNSIIEGLAKLLAVKNCETLLTEVQQLFQTGYATITPLMPVITKYGDLGLPLVQDGN